MLGVRRGRLRTLAANRFGALRVDQPERGQNFGRAHPRRLRPSLGLLAQMNTLKPHRNYAVQRHQAAPGFAPLRSLLVAAHPATDRRRNTACIARVAVMIDHRVDPGLVPQQDLPCAAHRITDHRRRSIVQEALAAVKTSHDEQNQGR